MRDDVLAAQWESLFDIAQRSKQPSLSAVEALTSLWHEIRSDYAAMKCLIGTIHVVSTSTDGCIGVLTVLSPLLWLGLERTDGIAADAQEKSQGSISELRVWMSASSRIELLKMRTIVVDLLKRLIICNFLIHIEPTENMAVRTIPIADFDCMLLQNFEKYCASKQWATALLEENDISQQSFTRRLIGMHDLYLVKVLRWLAGTGQLAAVTVMLGCYPERFLRNTSEYISDVLDLLPLGICPGQYRHLLPVVSQLHSLKASGSFTLISSLPNEESTVGFPISMCYSKQSNLPDDMIEQIALLQKDISNCSTLAEVIYESVPHQPYKAENCRNDELLVWYFKRLWRMEKFGQSSSAATLARIAVQGINMFSDSDSVDPKILLLQELSVQLDHFCSLLYGLSLTVVNENSLVATYKDCDEASESLGSTNFVVKLLPSQTTFTEWALKPLALRIDQITTNIIVWQHTQRQVNKKSTLLTTADIFIRLYHNSIKPMLFGPKKLFGTFNNDFSRIKFVNTFTAMVMGMGYEAHDLKYAPFDWNTQTDGDKHPPVVLKVAKLLYLRPTLDSSMLTLHPLQTDDLHFEGNWSCSGLEAMVVSALVNAISYRHDEGADHTMACILEFAKQSVPTLPIEKRLLSDVTQLGKLVLMSCRIYNIVTTTGLSTMWELLETTPVQFVSQTTNSKGREIDTSHISPDTHHILKHQMDLLQAALSSCEILGHYLAFPDAGTVAANALSGLKLCMLVPHTSHDKFERRKFSQLLMKGTGHFVASLDYLISQSSSNSCDMINKVSIGGETTFEHALILHCCSYFLSTVTVGISGTTVADTKNQKKIVASTLLNFVAGRVSDRITSAKDSNNAKENSYVVDQRAEQWIKLSDDMLTLVDILTTLGESRKNEKRTSIVCRQWIGHIIFQAMLQSSLAALTKEHCGHSIFESEFFSSFCCSLCSDECKSDSSPSIRSLAQLFKKEFQIQVPEVFNFLKLRSQASFNGSSSCTMRLPDAMGNLSMEDGLTEATFLCNIAHRISSSKGSNSLTLAIFKEQFSEEIHLLSVVNFIRHLDVLADHRRTLVDAQTVNSCDKDVVGGSIEVRGDSDEVKREATNVVEGNLDFVPLQLRIQSPVTLTQRIMEFCPRSYRTTFVYTGPCTRETDVSLVAEDFGEEFEDESSDDEPLRGMLARRPDPRTVRLEREQSAQKAIISNECDKLFPVMPVMTAKRHSSKLTCELKDMNDGANVLDEGDAENVDDDALLLQYFRSQTTLGSVFMQLMLKLPRAQEQSYREVETAIYAEVIKAAISVGEVEDAIDLAEVILKKHHDEDLKTKFVIGSSIVGPNICTSFPLIINAVSEIFRCLDTSNNDIKHRMCSLLLSYAPDTNLTEVCQLYRMISGQDEKSFDTKESKYCGMVHLPDSSYEYLARYAFDNVIHHIMANVGGNDEATPVFMVYNDNDTTSFSSLPSVKSLMADISGGTSAIPVVTVKSKNVHHFSAGIVMDIVGFLLMMRDSAAVQRLLDDVLSTLKNDIALVISRTPKALMNFSMKSRSAPAPNEEFVSQIEQMGFSRHGARRAVIATKNASMEVALRWAIEHSLDKDFDEPVVVPSSDANPKIGESGQNHCLLPQAQQFQKYNARGPPIVPYTSVVCSAFDKPAAVNSTSYQSSQTEHVNNLGALNKAVELVSVVAQCYSAKRETSTHSQLVQSPTNHSANPLGVESTGDMCPVQALKESQPQINAVEDHAIDESSSMMEECKRTLSDLGCKSDHEKIHIEDWEGDDNALLHVESTHSDDSLEIGYFGSDSATLTKELGAITSQEEIQDASRDVVNDEVDATSNQLYPFEEPIHLLHIDETSRHETVGDSDKQVDTQTVEVEHQNSEFHKVHELDEAGPDSSTSDNDETENNHTCVNDDLLLYPKTNDFEIEAEVVSFQNDHTQDSVVIHESSLEISDDTLISDSLAHESLKKINKCETKSRNECIDDPSIQLSGVSVEAFPGGEKVLESVSSSFSNAQKVSNQKVDSSLILTHLSEVSAFISRLEATLSCAVLDTGHLADPSDEYKNDFESDKLTVDIDLAPRVDTGQLAREIAYAYDYQSDSSSKNDDADAVSRKDKVVDDVLQIILALALHRNDKCFYVQLPALLELLPAEITHSISKHLTNLVAPSETETLDGRSIDLYRFHYIPTIEVANFFVQVSVMMTSNAPSIFDSHLSEVQKSNGNSVKLCDLDMSCRLALVRFSGIVLRSIHFPESLLTSSAKDTDMVGPYDYLKPFTMLPLTFLNLIRASYRLVPSGKSTSVLFTKPVSAVHSCLSALEYLKRGLSEIICSSILETVDQPDVAGIWQQVVVKQGQEDVATLRRLGRIPGSDAVNLKRLLLSGVCVCFNTFVSVLPCEQC